MGNIKFKTEKNGYMKDQVDRYIETFAGAYQDLTQAYEQLREQTESGKTTQGEDESLTKQIESLTKKLEEQEKKYEAQLKQKDSKIKQLNEEIEKLKKQEIGGSPELIAQVMIDAKVFAAKQQEQAQKEADAIRIKAKQDAQEIINSKKRYVDDLKKLQSMINDVIRSAEHPYVGGKEDSRHVG